jgi:FixJ family two-component response regulator
MQQTCKNLGAVAFIEKPFSHEDIEKLLNTVF